MRLILCAMIAYCGMSCWEFDGSSVQSAAAAESQRFPYAAVTSGKVPVRSGPGRNYYTTSELPAGTQTIVHRHDPGGWYMIAPLANSFSWILIDDVQTTDSTHGVVTVNNAVVRVGSQFSDARKIEHVRLSKGSTVHILGEKTFSTTTGTVCFYKIRSPRGEFRWVSGRYLIPKSAQAKRASNTDPYAIPSYAKREPVHQTESVTDLHTETHQHDLTHQHELTFTVPKLASPQLVPLPPSSHDIETDSRHATTKIITDHAANHTIDQHRTDRGSFTKFSKANQQTADQNRRLELLDTQFQTMLHGKPSHWDFSTLERGYQILQHRVTNRVFQRKIRTRLSSINRYKTVQSDYNAIMQITSQTDRREAKLAAVQQKLVQTNWQQPVQKTGTTTGHAFLEPTINTTNRQTQTSASSTTTSSTTVSSLPINSTPTSSTGNWQTVPGMNGPSLKPQPIGRQQTQIVRKQHSPKRLPKFDGAGVIRRVATRKFNAPQYALVTTDGKVLAYLQAVRGLPLGRYIGQPMGVIGRRTYRRDLQSDFIIVQAMMPVRLTR